MNSQPATELKTKRKPGRPRSKRSEEAIIRATTSLLADERYASLTVSKVAARARASKSTIYRRWPTKEHLVIEAFNRWPALTPHDRGDVMSDLLNLYRQFLRILHRPPSNAIMPTLVAERAHNPALAAVFDPLMQRRLALGDPGLDLGQGRQFLLDDLHQAGSQRIDEHFPDVALRGHQLSPSPAGPLKLF